MCDACNAKDYTIAILREQLRNKDSELEVVHGEYAQLVESLNDKLDHTLGIRREVNTDTERKMNPIRRQSGIRDRINRAENASKKPELVEQRRKEYDERIRIILNDPDLSGVTYTGKEDAKVS